MVACDSAVSAVNIFGFVDEADRGAGFQAGLVRKDGTARPSLSTFRDAIGAGCAGAQVSWSPSKGVVGAGVTFSDSSPKPAKQSAWNTSVTAGEDATARLGLFKVKTTGSRCTPGQVDVLQLFSGKGSATQERILDGEFAVNGGYSPLLQLDKQALAPGCYFYATVLTAAMNLDRQSMFVSDGFLAGPASKPAAKPAPAANKTAKKAKPKKKKKR
jgi:hypothetical protein